MSFNTNWDVDQYKTEHECEEHWELRRSFMLVHQDKFPEERLVCLAQVFTNIEFLGCRYPAETMELVANLASGVVDNYREKQKGRLQRTFVKASDAAGAKAKGLKRPAQEETAQGPSSSSSHSKSQTSKPPSKVQFVKPVQQNAATQNKPHFTSNSEPTNLPKVTYGPPICPPESKKSDSSSQSSASSNGSSRFSNSRYGGVKTYHIDQSSTGKSLNSGTITCGPYGKLVIVEPAYEALSATQIINMSAGACQVPMKVKYNTQDDKTNCEIFLNNSLLSSATTDSKKEAGKLAAEEGLKKLKEFCYTMKIKMKILSDTTIEKTGDTSNNSSAADSNIPITPAVAKTWNQPPHKQASGLHAPLSEDNIGNKLLKMMGWTGGGLGKDKQGIAEPVSVQEHVTRSGLGLSKEEAFSSAPAAKAMVKQKVRQMLTDYAHSDSPYDLVFSQDFTKDERKAFHRMGSQLRLKTKSYGSERERYLVISKKQDIWFTIDQLFQNGGSNERYELIEPGADPTE